MENRENLKNYVMRFSYQEKRKRKLENFMQEVSRLKSMNKEELSFEYIELKVEYDYRKNILTLFIISIALAVLMNTWKKVFTFMELALQYAAGDSSTDVTMVSFLISISILIFITLIILLLLFTIANDLKKIRRKLMIIEDVMTEERTLVDGH